MRVKILVIIAVVFLLLPFSETKAADTGSHLKGRILLQVESHGEAWYVNPKDGKRYYMADGNAAFTIMSNLGVGISNTDLERIKNSTEYRKKFMGKIFLQVESHGEAYYVGFDGRYYYLKDGAVAFAIMRKTGLGITNNNLNKIASASAVTGPLVSTACANNKNCEKYRNVDIVWVMDEEPYSETMKSMAVLSVNISTNLAPEALKLVKKALDKYPDGMLNRYLHRVYILNSLTFAGKPSIGVADNYTRNLYITYSNNVAETELTIHHELAHLIYDNKNIFYPEFETLWTTNNPEEFIYNYPYYYSYPGKSITAFRDDLGKKGFLTMYAETHFREDFAVMASHLFKNDPVSLEADFWNIIANYPTINEKFKLTVGLYNRLNPIFTEDYFRRISKE